VEECFILYLAHAGVVQVTDEHESTLLAEVNVSTNIFRVAAQVTLARRHLTFVLFEPTCAVLAAS